MAASPQSVVKRERIVIAVSAVVVVALIAGGAWASQRGSSPEAQAAASASPSTAASPPATLAAVDQTASPAPASPVAEPVASPALDVPEAGQTPAPETTSAPTQASTPTPTPTPRATAIASTPTKTPTPKPTRTHKATPRPTPTPTKTASTQTVPSAPHFVVQGKVAKKTYFTIKQLKKMQTFSGDYFSRGKEPPTATNAFVGVRLADILKVARPTSGASRVAILAADDYSASFSLSQVKASYIDETRPGVNLPMIIAWSEDGAVYTGDQPFRLVLGQAVEGDYNRQYWVKVVVSITVQ